MIYVGIGCPSIQFVVSTTTKSKLRENGGEGNNQHQLNKPSGHFKFTRALFVGG
jgi:hypothetical protein